MFAIDTCVIIELSKEPLLLEKFISWAKCQSGTFYVCESVVTECKREKTVETLTELKEQIPIAQIADPQDMDSFAESLTALGDGEIATLLFCKQNSKTAITFDKKAVNTCKLLSINFIDFKEKFMKR